MLNKLKLSLLYFSLSKYYPFFKAHKNVINICIRYSPIAMMPQALTEIDTLVSLIKKGILAQRQGKFVLSEQTLHLALKIALDIGDENHIAYIFDILANVAYDEGDLNKAEKLFKEVLQRIMLLNDENLDGLSMIEISLKLANIYGQRGEDYKAKIGFNYCIKKLQEKVKDNDFILNEQNKADSWALLGMAYHEYSKYLLQESDLKANINQAIDMLIKALNIAQNFLSGLKNSYDFAAFFNDKSKLRHINHKENINKDNNSGQNPQIYVIYNDLGSAYYKIGSYDKATESINQAIQGTHIILDLALSELANYAEDNLYLKERQKLYIQTLERNLSSFYINMGLIYLAQNKLCDGKTSCYKALTMATKIKDEICLSEAKQCLHLISQAL